MTGLRERAEETEGGSHGLESTSFLKEQRLCRVHRNVRPVWPKLPAFQKKSEIRILYEMSPFKNNNFVFMFHGASQICLQSEFSQWAKSLHI